MPILFFVGLSIKNLLYEAVPAGDTILEDILTRPALALTMLSGMAFGILSFITGIISIIRQKERALLVYIATMIGGLLILFLLGEISFPH
jgi:hypothetical protein